MTEYESNELEGEEEQNYEDNIKKEDNNDNISNDNYLSSMNNNNNKKIENNEEEEEVEQEQENDDNENDNKSDNNNNIKTNENKITENSISQNNNMNNNNTETKKTREEIEENPEILYEQFFNYFLPNKKSTLSIKECKNAMRCLGLVVTEKEIQEILEIKKKTGKEKINLEEFKYICNKKLTESDNNITELEEAFEMMDPENKGIIDSTILRHQMKVFKPKITDEEISQILSEFGEDENGNINYREYLKNLKS